MSALRFLSPDEAITAVERFAADHVPATSSGYFMDHLKRYVATLCHIPFPAHAEARALECGATPLFQWALKQVFGYETVDGTYFGGAPSTKTEVIEGPNYRADHAAYYLNLENDPLPVADDRYDFILFCEILEHMDVDPMTPLIEVNRTLKPGGQLLVTTPNSTSARIVAKILSGQAPHFFMKYVKSRDPYRHNFEYDVPSLMQLMEAAGFDGDILKTLDTFHEPPPGIIDFLAQNGFPTDARGDNIFYLGHKAGPIRDRYPPLVYWADYQ